MSDLALIHPDYIRVIERKSGGWSFKKGTFFYKRLPIATVDLNDTEFMYNISKQQIVTELFRVNGGKAGFYLADLRHKRYYYCGLLVEDVQTTLLHLGIGRASSEQE
jgi:hypothetical protein